MDRFSRAIELASKGQTVAHAAHSRLAGIDIDGLPSLSTDPDLLSRNKVIAHTLSHPVADYYRVLRTRLLRIMAHQGWKVLGVTGPGAAGGKSLTAANLSIAIGMEPSHRALLVDADLRKPSLARLLGCAPERGVFDLLSGRLSPADVAYRAGFTDHAVIFNTGRQMGSSDLLRSRPMQALITESRKGPEGDILLFDLPPTFAGDDVLAMSSLVDALLFVVDSGQSTHEQLQSMLELFRGVNVAGCILNNAPDADCLGQQYDFA